jgi:hypothetical protein
MKHTIFVRTKLFSPQSSEKVMRTTKKGRQYAICANNPFQKRFDKRATNAAIRSIWADEERNVVFPCRVRLTRIGPRKLDEDSFIYSFKYVRDEVADLLIPGLARGRADGDKRITWEYVQETGFYGIRIEIEFDEPSYRDGKTLC